MVRRRDRQGRAPDSVRGRQAVLQLRPSHAAVVRPVDAAGRAGPRNGREDAAARHRVEDDRVAPVVVRRDEAQPLPGRSPVLRAVDAAEVVVARHAPETYATDEDVLAVERIDRNRPNAPRQARRLGEGPRLPRGSAVGRPVDAVARVRVEGEVRLTRAAVQRRRRRGVDGQRADLQRGAGAPFQRPRLAGVGASPHATARRADPHAVGVGRIYDHRRRSAADVGRTGLGPVADQRPAGQRARRAPPFGHTRRPRCLTHRPRDAAPEPRGSILVLRDPRRRFAGLALLGRDLHSRSWRHVCRLSPAGPGQRTTLRS